VRICLNSLGLLYAAPLLELQIMKPLITAASFLLISATLLQAEKEPEWTSLFDGKTLSGWVTDKGQPVTEGWEVVDGTIHRVSKAGNIYTAESFKDFVLEFEWKVAPKTNSGLKYRFEQGIGVEYQVLDDLGTDYKPKHLAGEIYDVKAATVDKEAKPAGEWNQSKIVAKGKHLEHWLNGVKLVEIDIDSEEWNQLYAESKFAKKPWFARNAGPIQLQEHGGEVWFRNLRIQKLDKDS